MKRLSAPIQQRPPVRALALKRSTLSVFEETSRRSPLHAFLLMILCRNSCNNCVGPSDSNCSTVAVTWRHLNRSFHSSLTFYPQVYRSFFLFHKREERKERRLSGWGIYCAWKTTGYQSKPYDGKWTHARRPRRPRLNWIDTATRDLKSIGMALEEAEQAAVDREDCRGRVAQCVFDTG